MEDIKYSEVFEINILIFHSQITITNSHIFSNGDIKSAGPSGRAV